jgi:hypothetical protein
MFDDLDEDTRVLSAKPGGGTEDVIEQAFVRLRAAGADGAIPPAPAPAPDPARDFTDEITRPGSQSTSAWAQAPDTPAPIATSPAPQRPLTTLPSLRVAVLGTSVPGEVRLITLGAGDEPPPGAALAVLVPLSPADGEAVTRLFRGND